VDGRGTNPQRGPMGEARPAASIPAMIFPTVTELLPALEPVTADTFIAGEKPVAPIWPVRTRQIVD
jgi:hypothetical protein